MPARNGRTRALVSPAHPTPAKTGVLPETPNEISQDDQKGRPARPQAKPTPEVYPLGYIEDAGETRTKLPAFFIILPKLATAMRPSKTMRPMDTQEAVMSRLFMWSVASGLCLSLGTEPALAQQAAPVAAKSPVPSVASGTSNAVTTPAPAASPQMAEKSSLIVTKEYIIGPEDVLEITVWRNQDLSKVVAVRPDGRISMPLIGDVTAVGRTPSQLTDEIASRLKEFKENPSIAIVVKEVNSYAVFILGEVQKPGKYPLKSKTTLLQGITIAGGFTPTAARNKMVLFRFLDNGGGDERMKASYDDIVLRDGSRQNVELKPGDTVVVPAETMVLMP
jgi:polysaccharide biosynthesis/export protein